MKHFLYAQSDQSYEGAGNRRFLGWGWTETASCSWLPARCSWVFMLGLGPKPHLLPSLGSQIVCCWKSQMGPCEPQSTVWG